jgi:hypothetical protein
MQGPSKMITDRQRSGEIIVIGSPVPIAHAEGRGSLGLKASDSVKLEGTGASQEQRGAFIKKRLAEFLEDSTIRATWSKGGPRAYVGNELREKGFRPLDSGEEAQIADHVKAVKMAAESAGDMIQENSDRFDKNRMGEYQRITAFADKQGCTFEQAVARSRPDAIQANANRFDSDRMSQYTRIAAFADKNGCTFEQAMSRSGADPIQANANRFYSDRMSQYTRIAAYAEDHNCSFEQAMIQCPQR